MAVLNASMPCAQVDGSSIGIVVKWFETTALWKRYVGMETSEDFREFTEECERLAQQAQIDHDRPPTKLTTISFKAPPQHLKWSDLSPSFQREADAYLARRANPDLFDERPEAPRRPLAPTTIRQQREHLRVAASVLVQDGEAIDRLEDLVTPERFKKVLRHYHERANRAPNAFVIGIAKTLIQVAQ